MSQALNLSIYNATARSRIVILEPWGREFPLDVDEKLEIAARPGSGGAGLRLVEADQQTLVFVEGCSEVCVTRGGVTHNLDQEAVVGAAAPPDLSTPRAVDPMWDRDLDG